jgi:threonine synthase
MTRYAGELVCARCGSATDDVAPWYGCPRCLGEGVHANILPRYDLKSLAELPLELSQRGVFRYRDLLPIEPEAIPVTLAEGGTPLLSAATLADEIGVGRLWFKDESRNPTWSYKDRLAAVAVTVARHRGAETVALASTGNHGAAAAAYAAAAGLDCVVLTLASVPLSMKVLMQSYGATVLALDNGPDRWKLLGEAVREWGWVPVSGFCNPPLGSNPFGVDGYKTISYEILDELGEVPDVVVVPAAYGDGLAGIQRGFQDLVDIGVASHQPRLVAVDPFGAYARALAGGEPIAVPTGSTVAFSIGTPIATYQGLAALRASGGLAVGVREDERTMAAQRRIAQGVGIYAEASSAICLPALEHLVETGAVTADDSVVCIATSTGLKDVASSARRLPEVPVIAPELADLERQLVVLSQQ